MLELITGGELFDKIVAEGRFDEPTARFYFRQLLKGVKYCHSQGVCHRDLKPENLLLDANGDLKISDFGLSALYTGNADDEGRATLLHTTCGTPNYVAPEVLADRGYDGRAADVWSAGVILYVLLAGFLPFDEPHMSALFKKIQKAEFTYPSWFSASVHDLIDRILVPDPTKRITLSDIEAHPWFVGPDGYKDDGTDSMARSPGNAGPGAMPSGGGESSGRMMAHIPSAKDLEEAVVDLDDEAASEKPASATGSSSSTAASSGARTLNAFDVVNMFGGMTLSKILDGGASSSSSSSSAASKIAAPQFLSPFPAATILGRASAALQSLGATTNVDEDAAKVKGRVVTGRGEISITVVVYRMSDELHLVEVRCCCWPYRRPHPAPPLPLPRPGFSRSHYALFAPSADPPWPRRHPRVQQPVLEDARPAPGHHPQPLAQVSYRYGASRAQGRRRRAQGGGGGSTSDRWRVSAHSNFKQLSSRV